MIKSRRAFIVGLKGKSLTKKEILFLKRYKPWGIILFSRNIYSIDQVKNLTSHIKKIFSDNNYPIFIDQEGGRVSRLGKILTTKNFSGSHFGNLYKKDKKNFNHHLDIYINQISFLLRDLGININNSPVLDLRRKISDIIVGDRAFSNNKKIVSIIGKLFINKFHNNKIAAVIKHIPGHGLAKVDSHKKTPVVSQNLNYLLKNDFSTFKKQKSLFAMTAHIIFKQIDKINTVTHSKKAISIIRKKIEFKNIIISDDISMKALKLSITQNTIKAFNAGCNLVLHCNGRLSEMIKVAENSPKLDNFLVKKTLEFYKVVS